MPTAADHLAAFASLQKRTPFGYEHAHTHDGGKHSFHLVFGAITHGNEVGSLPAFVGIARALIDGSLPYGGRVTLMLGNPEAALAGQRLLEADLNRAFVDGDTHEHRRARQLTPILESADLFLDFHQVSVRTPQPFYTLPWSLTAWRWLRALEGAPVWITRPPGQVFATGTRGGDEVVRQRGKPGLTLELGEAGLFPEAAARTAAVIARALALADAIAEGRTTLAEASDLSPPLRFLRTAHKEPFGDPARALRPGLGYFDLVRAGERLERPGSPPIIAPVDGVLVFPKYVDRAPDGRALPPIPTDIFHIAQPMPQHPHDLWQD
ncbi:MAG: succinylglutamate desuccinylase/aspartoacylase family protein [Alphaproteobacteria bacterium]|nr:succinylglutamate desuccinylase/aspartoacylase family protein [Alphaproteobacteria bacterium]